MAVSNYPRTEHAAKCYGYIFWFKCIISPAPLHLSPPQSLFVADLALWFPGSTRLSISSSLHLSAAAEPGPHHPVCQSPLYTFNPSYPSLCKAASHPPPPYPPLSKQPSPQKQRSPFDSPTNTHSLTHAHRNIRHRSNRQDTLTIRYRYRDVHTHTHTHTHTQRDHHCTTPISSSGTPPLCLSFHQPIQ